MKPKYRLPALLSSTLAVVAMSSSVNAANIYWDGTTGSWNTNTNWSEAAGAATPNPVAVPGASDDLFFNISTANANTTTRLDADQAAQSITFNSTGTVTINGNTSGTTARGLTIGSGGITKNSGSGAVTIGGSTGVVNIALSANQTWTNNSSSALSIGTGFVSSATDANVALGSFNLIIGGTGRVEIGVSNQAEAVLTGTGTLTKNGTGVLQLGGVNSGYSGNVFINGGVVNTGDSPTAIGSGNNVLLNGGVLETRWSTAITRTQGTGANQIQITGGVSGLSGGGSGSGAVTHNIGAITWGSGTFNPTQFVLQSSNAGSGTTTLAGAINLGGSTRTIRSDQGGGLAGGGTGTFSGNISNGGITKEGVGVHVFSGTNSYSGGTNINAGVLRFATRNSMPASGTVTVADGATLGVEVAGSGTTWGGGTGVAGIAGLTSTANSGNGFGGQTGAVVDFNGNSSLNLNVTGNVSESNVIGNGSATSIRLIKSGASTLTLTGDNTYSGGTTLLAGTLAVGHANALGTGTISLNGGTIQSNDATARTLTNAVTIGGDFTVGGTGNLTFSNTGASALGATRQITVNTGRNATFAQAFSGAGFGITKAGAGTLTLTGNNTFTGATTINAGTLVLNNGGNVTGSSVTFGANNTGLTITGGGTSSNWNAGGGNFGTGNAALSNIQVLIDGAGTAGSARVTNVGTLIWGRTATGSTLSLTNGGEMNVNGEIRIGNPYYSEGGGANLTIGGGTATSTFTGTASASDFYIGYGERTGSKDNVVTVSSGGVLTGIRDMVVGHVFDAQNNANPSTNNQLLVTGTGTASMRGISLGFANASSNRTANANIVSVTGGGTLTSTGAILIGRANLAGSQSNSNTMTVSGTGSTWNASSQNVTIGSTNNATAISNNNTLTVGSGGTVTGIATLTLGSGTGTETGNELVMLGGGSLTATTISVSAGNTLRFGTGSTTSGLSLTGNITNNGSMVFNLSDTITQGTNFDNAFGGTGSVTQNGAGTLVLNGANTYSGGTNLNAGTVSFANGSLHSSGNITFTGNSTLQWNGTNTQDVSSRIVMNNSVTSTFDTNGNNVSFANGIGSSSSGSLTKTGNGTLTLNGANTYSGATNVTGGTLLIAGTGSINNSSGITVQSGAEFKYNSSTALTVGITNNGGKVSGSGNLGAIVLGGTGSIDPGNSPGIMTGGSTDPSGGLDYNFEFTMANAEPTWSNATASGNDVLRLTDGTAPFAGLLDGDNVVNIYLDVASVTLGDVFTGGFFTDRNADFLSAISSGSFQFFIQDAGGLITYNGETYSAYAGVMTVDTIQIASADFAGGTITNGWSTQFTAAVPEPGAALLGGIGTLLLLRRRRGA